MDRVDEIVFQFNNEKRESPESKKMMRIVITLGIFALIIFSVMVVYKDEIQEYLKYYFGAIFIILGILYFLPYWFSGRLGTRKRKKKICALKRERFLEEQGRLIKIIKEKGMMPQQVYNILNKKNNRIPQNKDKGAYIISISSIVITLANIFIQPLGEIALAAYEKYFVVVILLLIFCGEFAFIAYLVISVCINSGVDENQILKDNNYKYILKLLEDYVS